MADFFDPYHKWLGIPLDEQPADYYRLLGVRRFEPDADVIEGAVDKQMTHVRSFQNGPHAKASQKLLNELTTARLCLLSDDKRLDYDAQLRAAMKVSEPKITSVPPPPGDTSTPTVGVNTQAPGRRCPVCGASLPGEYRKCVNCLTALVWQDGTPQEVTPKADTEASYVESVRDSDTIVVAESVSEPVTAELIGESTASEAPSEVIDGRCDSTFDPPVQSESPTMRLEEVGQSAYNSERDIHDAWYKTHEIHTIATAATAVIGILFTFTIRSTGGPILGLLLLTAIAVAAVYFFTRPHRR
jgi:hypothetical protein